MQETSLDDGKAKESRYPNDIARMALVASGNNDALKKVVAEFQDKVFNTCLGFVKSTDDADDLAQEVFITIFEKATQFRGESSLSTWIYRISITKSLEFLRKEKSRQRFIKVKSLFGFGEDEEPQIIVFEHPGIELEQKEDREAIAFALDHLPENQRVALTMCKIEGLKYDEIAEVMKISVGAVESLIHRAKENMKQKLKVYFEKK
ncbi:MAG: RNA polymerase sigma factor [Chloroherpetonaceae bacterium]|nr:RNA polymerase sigma factor [Chloroherpetonaceae bacterium]